MTHLRAVEAFIRENPGRALVEVVRTRGSTPREEGAWMLVSASSMLGTIGGGALEFMAIDRARAALAGNVETDAMDVPLGPEIGQCCGGRVELSIRLMNETSTLAFLEGQRTADACLPNIFVFGGGHVGHALAAAFALLPVKVAVVETRAEALEGMPERVASLLTPVPEEAVREAPPGSAIVVLTHDHALDFLIVAEALRRQDLPYVGMIGSKTKRATFKNWYLREADGTASSFDRLVCPIGGDHLRDKRPQVIAALAAAEIITILAAGTS